MNNAEAVLVRSDAWRYILNDPFKDGALNKLDIQHFLIRILM